MRNSLLICCALSLPALAGCGSEAVTHIPDSISETEILELETDQQSVEQEERSRLQEQRQQRRSNR